MNIIKFLKGERGSAVLMIALLGSVVLVMFVYGIVLMVRSGSKSSLHSKKSTEARQIVEVGVKQMISDIHRRDPGSGGEYSDLGPCGLESQMNDLTGSGTITKIRRDYVMNNSTVSAVLTLVPDLSDVDGDGITMFEPETDVENNPVYQIDSVATVLLDQQVESEVKKHVIARISIINIGKYLIFNVEENPAYREGWWASPENKFDGYIHCNGDLRIRSNVFVNTLYHPITPGAYSTADPNYPGSGDLFKKNPYYYPDYTVVVAGDIKKMNYHNTGWVLCRTQAERVLGDPDAIGTNPYSGEPSGSLSPTDESNAGGRGMVARTVDGYTSYISPDNTEHGQWSKICGGTGYDPSSGEEEMDNDLFDVVPNATQIRGTWFDGRHGGFVVNLEPLDYTYLSSNADVIIDLNDLPTFKIFGTNYTSNRLKIDLHFPSRDDPAEEAVHIDLGALGTGLETDVCGDMDGYTTALSDNFGLVIYVIGPCAVHGKLANASGANDTNKKVTIVSTDEIDIIGDILYSDDYYMQVLENFDIIGPWNDDIDVTPGGGAENRGGWPQIRNTTDPYELPFNDYNGRHMEVQVKRAGGTPGDWVVFEADGAFTIVAPHPDVNKNKVYVNIREDAAVSCNADVSLILEDNTGVLIASNTLTATTTWQRLSIPDVTYSTTTLTLSCTDVVRLGDPGNEGSISLQFSNLPDDNIYKTFLVDELCFAVGRPEPLRVDFDNDPNPCNPNEDAITLISSGDININPWYLHERMGPETAQSPNPDSIKYFAINGDYMYVCPDLSSPPNYYYALKTSCLLYMNTPGCGRSWRQVYPPERKCCWSNGFQVENYLQYGGIIKRRTSYGCTREGYYFYDREFQHNVSKIIPVGTAILSWEEK